MEHLFFFQAAESIGCDPRRQTGSYEHQASKERAQGDDEVIWLAGRIHERYSTRMRGGFLRFQAQYLRRIRVPRWLDVPKLVRRELVCAAKTKDLPACNRAAFELYGLSKEEKATLEENS